MTGWTEGETVGNSLGRAPLGRSEMEASTGWTEGKTVGNSLGRGPSGRSDTEATARWTDGEGRGGETVGKNGKTGKLGQDRL